MYLSIATTHRPATDLGFLLMKHPDRVHEVELAFGRALVVFPQADEERCEATLILDLDPVALVRGRGKGGGIVDQYVNDRPYAASSFLSVGLNRAFRTAMAGTSRERQDLAASPIPLDIVVAPLPAPDESLLERLFAPLGWSVAWRRIEGAAATPRYVELRLSGRQRLADALSHLYVLVPTLDDDKHYWVGDEEVDKLVAKGGSWLPHHPERDLIARRYLKSQRGLARAALARLSPGSADEPAVAGEPASIPEEVFERPVRLHEHRLDAVASLLRDAGVRSVADLGCGEGRLLVRLAADARFERLVGVDASLRDLERAAERLRQAQRGTPTADRVELLHGALTYRDPRWAGVEAAVLVEVIEHVDEDRLPALVEAVFGTAGLRLVVVTTPNAEHNVLFEGLRDGGFRHPDHRFEWRRDEFRTWAERVAAAYGFAVTFPEIGTDDPVHGPVTQVGLFTR